MRAVKCAAPAEAHKHFSSTTSSQEGVPGSKAEIQESKLSVERRIHILGTGNIGKLVAHSLRSLSNPPPVTLLFHTSAYYYSWLEGEQNIKITTNGITVSRNGFDVEKARSGWRRHGRSLTVDDYFKDDTESGEPRHLLRHADFEDAPFPDALNKDPIQNLIVVVKAPATVGALLPIRHRLERSSTILFLQNGMGMIDEVNEQVFPDPHHRPNYMLGVVSHGVTDAIGPFTATHAGQGTIALGGLIRTRKDPSELAKVSSFRYLQSTLCRSPVLAAVAVTSSELQQAQLEKLAVNAIINPITALIDAQNGAILFNMALTRVLRLLLAEISLVIQAMPELKSLPNLETRFSPERLESEVRAVAFRTAQNLSSMAADVREGRTTEIDYINGYIVKRGEELGITCFMNYIITQLIKGKKIVVDREKNEELPLTRSKKRPQG